MSMFFFLMLIVARKFSICPSFDDLSTSGDLDFQDIDQTPIWLH